MGDQSRWPPPAKLWDHWTWRPEWREDRVCLLWYLTFPPHQDLWAMATAVHDGVRAVGALDAVPHEWLHLTVDDVGFADEVPPGLVEVLVQRVREAMTGWEPPPVSLGPVTTMEDALVLAAGPAPDLVKLRDLLRAETREVLPDAESGLDAFLPHVTLAYAHTEVSTETLLAPLAGTCGAEVEVDDYALVLAAVTRRDRHYQWQAEAVLPLSRGSRLTAATGTARGRRRPA